MSTHPLGTLHNTLRAYIQEVSDTPDPLERARAAHAASEVLGAVQAKIAEIRNHAVVELVEGGTRPLDIAEALGVNKSRVTHMRTAATRTHEKQGKG